MGPKAAAATKVQKTIEKKETVEKKENSATGQVPADFEFDEDARYSGVVDYFNRKSGFGFISMNDKDVVPEDRIMVHWNELQSDDRWPYLHKGLEVEFGLKMTKSKDRKCNEMKAKMVSAVGGGKINLCDENDGKKEFCGDQTTRFTGSVKWYNNTNGIGYMKLEEGYDLPEDIPDELRITREELNVSSGSAPHLRDGMECEFGIVKSTKGTWCVYNVTLPGGDPINRETVEQRVESDDVISGEIAFWKADDQYGYIRPDNLEDLTGEQLKKLRRATAKHTRRNLKNDKDECEELLHFHRRDRSTGGKMFRGEKVTFKVYMDYRGIGAFEVTQEAK